MNNRKYSKSPEFAVFCKNAKFTPTVRQASKFRNKKGIVYKTAQATIRAIKEIRNAAT